MKAPSLNGDAAAPPAEPSASAAAPTGEAAGAEDGMQVESESEEDAVVPLQKVASRELSDADKQKESSEKQLRRVTC